MASPRGQSRRGGPAVAAARLASVASLLLALCALPRTAVGADEIKPPAENSNVHVAFLTDCTIYSNWQSVAMVYSHKRSGMPGKITRVMCCTEDELKKYPKDMLDIVPTHIAPSFAVHPRTHDNYAAYNKPEAVIDWLDHVTPEEDWILVLDSDMILRRPFLPDDMKAKKGLAVGARYTYMIGVNNELAVRHVPEVAPRNDTLAGPYGRRGDQVGGFFFIHRDDLKKMCKGWLKYTEDVRADPEAWRLSGDVYATHPGDKPWISEMYGYAFGAAKADVWHRWDSISMIYPEYVPSGMPKVMHYGLHFKIGADYGFDKHWHYDFDVTSCPPYKSTLNNRRTAGMFPNPPRVSSLSNKDDFGNYYKDVLSIETVATMNAGICEYHLQHCPVSEELTKACAEALSILEEASAAATECEEHFECSDKHVKCPKWAADGECDKNPSYMAETCLKSCKICSPRPRRAKAVAEAPRPDKEEKKVAPVTSPADNGGSNADGGGKATTDLLALQKAADALKPKQSGTSGGDGGGRFVPPKTDKAPEVVVPSDDNVVAAPKKELPSKHLAQQQQQGGGGGSKDSSSNNNAVGALHGLTDMRMLLIKCYKASLPADEVKECVAAARQGKPYTAKVRLESAAGGSGDDADGARTLQQADVAAVKAPHVGQPRFSWRQYVAHMTTWQALLLWVIVLWALLGLGPKLLKKRGPKSMRQLE